MIDLAHNTAGFQLTTRSLDEMPLREVTLWRIALDVWREAVKDQSGT